MSTQNKQTVEEQIAELDALLAWFESDDVTVDEALTKYERAQVLSKELTAALQEAKNKVEVIKQKYS
ncbi:exodeoxyribonuclease VII small subunit [Candidatus Saccharibacteria bacterium]|nr:exodeoxyribonuclease VII small subunit [Candidatus Saccharibacteria bacterium]